MGGLGRSEGFGGVGVVRLVGEPADGGHGERQGSGVAAGAGPTMTLEQGRAMKLKVVIREAEEGGIWRQGC